MQSRVCAQRPLLISILLIATTAVAADDEIDWDEDDTKASTAPAAAALAAGGQGRIANPVAVPNQKLDVDPAKASDLTTIEGKDEAAGSDVKAPTGTTATVTPTVPAAEEAPKQDFSMGIGKTDAEKEAEKRAARAKRFGITEDDEEKKKLERAKKFGTEPGVVVRGLDDALPERRAKRGREGDRPGGRAAKRQTPDRRTESAPAKAQGGKPAAKAAPAPAKKAVGRVTDDPVEKAKAEARAKRFQTTA